MKPFAVAAAGWTIGALIGLVLVGGHIDNPGCGVGEALQAECNRRLAVTNAELFANHTLPLLVTIAAGYVTIALVAVVAARRRGGSPG